MLLPLILLLSSVYYILRKLPSSIISMIFSFQLITSPKCSVIDVLISHGEYTMTQVNRRPAVGTYATSPSRIFNLESSSTF
jgi:hypothetical protein